MECVSIVVYTFKCLYNLYFFIHVTYIRTYLINVYSVYLIVNLTQHFLFSSLLLLITKAKTRQPLYLLREGEPCLISDWTVLKFLSSLQRVHKHLIQQSPCSCSQKFTRKCKTKFLSPRVLASPQLSERSLRASSPGITLTSKHLY